MREITYAQAICEAMSEEMRRDPKVFFMGEDVGAYFRSGHHGRGCGCGHDGDAADYRDHVLGLYFVLL